MQVREINIHIKRNFTKWKKFLQKTGINEFSPKETAKVERTFAWFQDDEMVATGSIAGNVLKYIAVCSKVKGHGETFNQLVSKLVNEAATMGRFHLFVFTKPQYVQSFGYVGFHKLAEVADGAILESGTPDIHDYLKSLPHFADQATSRIGGIVMNANPFTNGHRYLVERASRQNDHVYVFVVSQEASLFSFAERFQLVRQGVADLANVVVVPGKEYMVSYATFPAYFLKDNQDVAHFQAALDAQLFKQQVALPLNIRTRYVGSEPYSPTTNIYNDELNKVLPPDVEVKVLQRAVNADKDIISATKVRAAIASGNLEAIQNYVPQSTLSFIHTHWSDLRARIKEGSLK